MKYLCLIACLAIIFAVIINRPSIRQEVYAVNDGAKEHPFLKNLKNSPSLNNSMRRSSEGSYLALKQNKLADELPVSALDINWFEVGPNDVGGRVRALAIDSENSMILIAGGVTGGIWKTRDGGGSWSLKSGPTSNFSITSIVQHPSSPGVWYASTGEIFSSASLYGSAAVFGSGTILTSTDGGETWKDAADVPDEKLFLTSKIIVSPVTHTIFVASHGYGIARSTDGAQSFEIVLGDNEGDFNLDFVEDNFIYSDVVVTKDGKLLASLSGELSAGAGYYLSRDDGIRWINITPADIGRKRGAKDLNRTVFAIAPSNPNAGYALTQGGIHDRPYGDIFESIYFHKINIRDGTMENRSGNLPKIRIDQDHKLFYVPVTQHSYNMAMAVKPDDEDFVVYGGVGGPYRTTDGHATDAGTYDHGRDLLSLDLSKSMIHGDQHISLFDPKNPNVLWSGNDGGIARLNDVTNSGETTWEVMNNGLNVTQFYDLAIAPEKGDNRVIGSSQDNSHILMKWDESNTSVRDKTVYGGGDGSSVFWVKDYVITDGGGVALFHPSQFDQPPFFENIVFGSIVFPIHAYIIPDPYSRSSGDTFTAIDPNDEDVIFYGAGLEVLYRTTEGRQLLDLDGREVPSKFKRLTYPGLANGLGFTAMKFTSDVAGTLYFSLSPNVWTEARPKMFKLRDAATEGPGKAEEISSGLFPVNGQIPDIAVNPHNGNELIVVVSGDGATTGLFYSQDGGDHWGNVTGNLSDEEVCISFRCAEIINGKDGRVFLTGTSTGLFSSSLLRGESTIWKREALDLVGSSVISDIDYRAHDNIIGISTHGRGIFMGRYLGIGGERSGQSTISTMAINVFPNPATDYFNIEIKNRGKIISFRILDLHGKVIFSKKTDSLEGKKFTVRTETLSSGLYVVEVVFDDFQRSFHKVIVR